MREYLPNEANMDRQFKEVIDINSVEEDDEITIKETNILFKLRKFGLFLTYEGEYLINKIKYVTKIVPDDNTIFINNYKYYLAPLSIQIVNYISERSNMEMLHINDYMLLSVICTLINEPKFISFYLSKPIMQEIDREDYLSKDLIEDKILYMIFKTTMMKADSLVLSKQNKYVKEYETKMSLIVNEATKYLQSVINQYNLNNFKWIQKINNMCFTNPFSLNYIYAIIKLPTSKDEYFANKMAKIEYEVIKSKENDPNQKKNIMSKNSITCSYQRRKQKEMEIMSNMKFMKEDDFD